MCLETSPLGYICSAQWRDEPWIIPWLLLVSLEEDMAVFHQLQSTSLLILPHLTDSSRDSQGGPRYNCVPGPAEYPCAGGRPRSSRELGWGRMEVRPDPAPLVPCCHSPVLCWDVSEGTGMGFIWVGKMGGILLAWQREL